MMDDRDISCAEKRKTISHNRILLTEGKDVLSFISALVRILGLTDQVEIRDFGGNPELRGWLKAFRNTEGFENVEGFAIIRDAETNLKSGFDSVCDSLHTAGFAPPQKPGEYSIADPRVGVFMLPDCQSTGTIETMCIRSIASLPATRCVDEYFSCLDKQGNKGPKNLEKAKVQTFLASLPDHPKHLGLAAQQSCWDWASPAFKPLLDFVKLL